MSPRRRRSAVAAPTSPPPRHGQSPDGAQFGIATADEGKRAIFRQKREGVDEYIEGEGERIEYDGKADVVRFINRAVIRRFRGAVLADDVTPELISQHIYAPEVPPCDIIVRTSGEQRLSNFMLWRSAYSELYFIDKNWPDMRTEDVDDILDEYARRNRRLGK